MARPSKIDDIDKEIFERILSRFNTLETTAFFFGVSKSSLRSWVKSTYGVPFEDVEHIFQSKGRAALLDKAWAMASRYPAVMIFLLKNFCGLSDDPRPVDTGAERKEFQSAISTATKALNSLDMSAFADIPPADDGKDKEGSDE